MLSLWVAMPLKIVTVFLILPILALPVRAEGISSELLVAAQRGKTAKVKTLLETGAEVNWKNNFGWTALMKAAMFGHTDTVEVLLNAGADVNRKNNRGLTALIEAAKIGHYSTVEVLLEAGADKNIKDKTGHTALNEAQKAGHKNIIKLLRMTKDGHAIPTKKTRALTLPDKNIPPDTTPKRTIKMKRSVKDTQINNSTPSIAIKKDPHHTKQPSKKVQKKVQKKVKLENVTPPSLKANKNTTAKVLPHKDRTNEIAAKQPIDNRKKEIPSIANLLNELENNTDLLSVATPSPNISKQTLGENKINVKNLDDFNTLTEVETGGLNKIVSILKEIESLNMDLLNAARKGDTAQVQKLLDKGADVNAKDKDDGTALILAVWNGHRRVVEVLLKKGADINAKTKSGNTALMLAKDKGYARIINALQRVKAQK